MRNEILLNQSPGRWLVLWLLMLPLTILAQTTINRNQVQTLTTGQTYSFQNMGNGGASFSVDGTYYFPELWEKVSDYELRFKGITGDYKVAVLESGEKTNKALSKPFIRVEPMQSSSADANNGYAMFAPENGTNANSSKFGYGPIWVIGGKNFGFPSIAGEPYSGWTETWTGSYHGDNTKAWGDSFVALAMPEQNLHQITLETGEQISNTDFNIKFYFCCYYKELTGSDVNNWTHWNPRVEWRGSKDNLAGIPGNYWTNDDSNYKYLLHVDNVDFLKIRKGESQYRENNGGEAQYNPAWNNGNLSLQEIAYDSDLPNKVPEHYKFQITIDLRNISSNDFTNVPVDITILQRGENDQYNHTAGAANKEYTVNLNNSTGLSGTKRIKLRDALRFDCNLPYAESYDADHYENVPVMNKLVITGALDFDDMEYLTWLARHDRIKRLDLSQATLLGNKIPADFAHSDYENGAASGTRYPNQNLTEVILPSALQTIEMNAFQNCQNLATVTFIDKAPSLVTVSSQVFRNCPKITTIDMSAATGLATIGGSAFTDCRQLTSIDISGANKGQVRIGDNAFHSCTALPSAQINTLIEKTKDIIDVGAYQNCTSLTTLTITDNITQIWQSAFAENPQLTDITVPATATSTVTPIAGKENAADWNESKGEVYGTVKTLSSSNSLKIEAEDFNKTENKGWYHSDTRNEDNNTAYRTDGVKNGIKDNDNYSNKQDIGYNEQASGATGWNWFNYTFYCDETAYYTVGAGLGSGNPEAKRVDITFSDNATTYTVNMPAYGSGRNKQGWDQCEPFENVTSKVLLKKGYHVMHVSVPNGGIELDYFTLTFAESFASESSVITNSIYENSWQGVAPNNCEVHFTGDDTSNNYQEYRNANQKGWMYLLTKTLDQGADYSNVNQEHADVKMTRTFRVVSDTERQKNWYSVVFPFPVDAATLLRVKTDDGKYVFDRAAVVDNDDFKYKNYPNVHFSYLNNSSFLAKWKAKEGKTVADVVEGYNPTNGTDVSLEYDDVEFLDAAGNVLDANAELVPAGTNVIPAGTPFIVRTYNVNSSKQYLFTDVHTYPSTGKSGNHEWESNLTKTIGDKFSFVGNIYNSHRDFKTGEWYLSGGWYAGKDNDEAYWVSNYRAIFTAPASAAPQLYRFLFGGGDATGIRLADEDAVSAGAGCIYNLSGQLVRKGTSTEGLSKGIYIINGKRVAVK